jgi:hypothetical protein
LLNLFRWFFRRARGSAAPVAPELVAMISVIGGDRVLRQWSAESRHCLITFA